MGEKQENISSGVIVWPSPVVVYNTDIILIVLLILLLIVLTKVVFLGACVPLPKHDQSGYIC